MLPSWTRSPRPSLEPLAVELVRLPDDQAQVRLHQRRTRCTALRDTDAQTSADALNQSDRVSPLHLVGPSDDTALDNQAAGARVETLNGADLGLDGTKTAVELVQGLYRLPPDTAIGPKLAQGLRHQDAVAEHQPPAGIVGPAPTLLPTVDIFLDTLQILDGCRNFDQMNAKALAGTTRFILIRFEHIGIHQLPHRTVAGKNQPDRVTNTTSDRDTAAQSLDDGGIRTAYTPSYLYLALTLEERRAADLPVIDSPGIGRRGHVARTQFAGVLVRTEPAQRGTSTTRATSGRIRVDLIRVDGIESFVQCDEACKRRIALKEIVRLQNGRQDSTSWGRG